MGVEVWKWMDVGGCVEDSRAVEENEDTDDDKKIKSR